MFGFIDLTRCVPADCDPGHVNISACEDGYSLTGECYLKGTNASTLNMAVFSGFSAGKLRRNHHY
jgi:hypothetical protein